MLCVFTLPGYAVTPDEEREEALAYSLGTHAYTFGFPWVYLSQLRYMWTQVSPPEGALIPYAAVNTFYQTDRLVDATYRDGGSPNNDTLFSVAWIDVRDEPIILSHPDINDRYFTFEIASMDSDNFAYVGLRETGSKAGDFAIVGPDWEGELPEGVQAIPRSRTNTVLMLGRILVDGQEDIPNAQAYMAQYRLTPLSQWGNGKEPVVKPRKVLVPFDRKTDPLADWKTMNAAMTQAPPEARHHALLDQFATLHIGPGQDVEKASAATKRGLASAAKDSLAMFSRVVQNGIGRSVNGWTYPPEVMGRAGESNNFLIRATVQCLTGIISHDQEEAIYLNAFTDFNKDILHGDNAYTIRFSADNLPPINDLGFWSMTLYGLDYNLVDNEIDRYSIGNRTKSLLYGEDGSLTLYVQAERPVGDKAANWLPSPTGREFYVVLRTYLPKAPLITQSWAPPALNKN
jgi:hypothetical protein